MIRNRLFIPALDGLRFVAFLFIFIHHTNFTHSALLQELKQVGWIGVDIFFCLSAFLLTRLLHTEYKETGHIHMPNFFLRRALRIAPLYFTYCLFIILLSIYLDTLTTSGWSRLPGLITFTDNLFTAFDYYNPIRFSGHLWTISYEEQFYLLLPFIVLLFLQKEPRQRNLMLFAFLIFGTIVRGIFIHCQAPHPAIWVLPITHFESILAGIFLAYNEIPKLKLKIKIILSVTAVGGTAVLLFLQPPDKISYQLMILYPCVGIMTGSLVALILTEDTWLNKLLAQPLLVSLGKISFGLYVFHIFCFALTDHLLRFVDFYTPWLSLILSLLLTVTIASASYHLLEKHFLRLKKRITVIPSRPI